MNKLFISTMVLFSTSLSAASSSSSSQGNPSVIQQSSVITVVYEIDDTRTVSVWIDDEGRVNAEQYRYTKHGELSKQCIGTALATGSYISQNNKVSLDEDFRFTIYAVLISASVEEKHARILTDAIYPLHYLHHEDRTPLLEIPIRMVGLGSLLQRLSFDSDSSSEDRSPRSSSLSPRSSPRRGSSSDSSRSPLVSPRLGQNSTPRSSSSSPRRPMRACQTIALPVYQPLSLSDGSNSSSSTSSPLTTPIGSPRTFRKAGKSPEICFPTKQPSVPDALSDQSPE